MCCKPSLGQGLIQATEALNTFQVILYTIQLPTVQHTQGGTASLPTKTWTLLWMPSLNENILEGIFVVLKAWKCGYGITSITAHSAAFVS